MSSYDLAPYAPNLRADYLGLLRQAWGGQTLDGDEFDWWFEQNPAGSLMSVAEQDGRVVGVAAHSLYRMVLGGDERLVSFSVHATTHESARGQGIFAALERRHEEQARERDAAVVLAFASAPTAPIFLGPLGWTEIGHLRAWARPLPALARRLLRRPPRTSLAQAREPSATSVPVGGDAARSWPNHVVRDTRFLQWRYVDSPRGYRVLTSPGGYAVVGHRLQRGISAAILADLAAPPGEVRGLLRRAIRASAGAEVMFALPAPDQRATFASLGFVPSPLRLHFMGKALAGALDVDPAAWRFTLGDTDFF